MFRILVRYFDDAFPAGVCWGWMVGEVGGDASLSTAFLSWLVVGAGVSGGRCLGISGGSPWSWRVVRFVVSSLELSGDCKYIRWLSGASVFGGNET